MVVEDLWIGDLLRLKRSGRIGKFEGVTSEQKLKIKVGDKIISTTIGNVEYAPKDLIDSDEKLLFTESQTEKYNPKPILNIIDLHMDVLKPAMKNARPERIIHIQIEAAREFIEDSIYAKTRKIEIIHGKGEGVLKSEILHLLSLYDEVEHVYEKNQGGSSEIWLGRLKQ